MRSSERQAEEAKAKAKTEPVIGSVPSFHAASSMLPNRSSERVRKINDLETDRIARCGWAESVGYETRLSQGFGTSSAGVLIV